MDIDNISSQLAKDFAEQLANDFKTRQTQIREALIELARLEAEITQKQGEVADVRASCQKAIQEAQRERAEYEHAASLVKTGVLSATVALDTARAQHAAEIQDHAAKLGELKAQYRTVAQSERDNIARLVATRAAIKAEIHALLDKLKGLA